MQKKLIVVTLLLLFTLPSFCFAANNSDPPSLFDYAFARTMAMNYALDLKEKYANATNDKAYLEAKLKYQIAAAKFTGLKAILELTIINRKDITNIDDSKFTAAGDSALKAYFEFATAAEKALEKKITPTHDKVLTVAEGISIVNTLKELYDNYKTIQDTKFTNMSIWLEKYFSWTDWYAIGQEKNDSSPEPVNPDKPKPKPNN